MEFGDFKDLLSHQRAIRVFDTSRPVDDETIEQVIRVGTYAPSGGNRQPWRFLVIRDPATKGKIGDIFDELGAVMYGSAANAPEHTHWRDVPALIAVMAEANPSAGVGAATAAAASIYPCVQNMLLAAHALGLGTVLTTRWRSREPEVKPLLGVPDNVDLLAIIPIGWPTRKYGRGKRMPVREVTYRERFGTPWKA